MASLPLVQRNRRTGLIALAFALLMLGLGYAAVPLYDLFCRVTGYGGTTQRASAAQAAEIRSAAQTITVRFDGNVDRAMPWRFGPEQIKQELRLGQRQMAYYKAKNLSDKPVTGVASFNVAPEQAGKYFTKIQCFCFERQTLQAGQEVDMPVNYFVDPKIKDDPDARDIQEITLSYTFHVAADDPS